MKVEKFEVEKKSFQVKFEGSNGGTWISVTERSQGFVVSVGFEKEELDWLTEHLKKAVELEASRGFIRKIRGKTRTHLMEICDFLVQDYSDQAGGALKETFRDAQVSKGIYRGCRSYAEVVAEDGPRNGVLLSVGKWARAIICECKEKVQDWIHEGKAIARMMGTKGTVSITPISAFKGCFFVDSARRAEWFQEQGRLLVRGRSILLKRWSPSENMKWGRVTKVARESLKLADLSKVKLWVETLPNVVLPALLEVEDGAWTFTVAVSVTGEVDEDDISTSESTRNRDELLKAGGCVSQWSKNAEGLRDSIRDNECYNRRLLPQSRYRYLSTKLAAKRENGWEGPMFKAQPVRAQSGTRNRGRHAGPVVSQAHETIAVVFNTPARWFFCKGGRRRGFLGEDGRAFEIKAQSLPNPSPPSDAIVGYNLKGSSWLGQRLGGTMSSVKKGRSRREEDVAVRKGKALEVQTRGSAQKEEKAVSKKMWTTLFLQVSIADKDFRVATSLFSSEVIIN
ncbi:hypothetical protein AAG906_016120 [Vitis piasezkii]